MAKFIVLLALFAVIAQISLACPPHQRCTCGSHHYGGLIDVNVGHRPCGKVIEDKIHLYPVEERAKIISYPVEERTKIISCPVEERAKIISYPVEERAKIISYPSSHYSLGGLFGHSRHHNQYFSKGYDCDDRHRPIILRPPSC